MASKKAQKYMGNKIEHLMEKENMPQDQAVAVAYQYARKKGYKVSKKEKGGKPDVHCSDHEKYAEQTRRGNNLKVATKKWKY